MSVDDSTLTSLRKQREGYRLNANRELEKAKGLIASSDVDAPNFDLKVSKQKLEKYHTMINDLTGKIMPNLDSEGQTKDISLFGNLTESLIDVISQIEVLAADWAARTATSNNLDSSATSSGIAQSGVRLPKIEIDHFSGDPLKWQEFWDSYESTIHTNAKLTDQEKFKYLRSFLSGEALSITMGYRLTSANYESVVDMLKLRFGNPELAIFTHLDAMLALPVASMNVSELQHVFDKCECHIRSLVALGLQEDTFGQVFTPIVLSKLPQPVRIELHRRKGADAWKLSHLRQLLRDEILARTMGHKSFDGRSNSKESFAAQSTVVSKAPFLWKRNANTKPKHAGSASALVHDSNTTVPNVPSCFFCSEKHYSSQCRRYADLRSRQIKVNGRCFLCLREGHQRNRCRSNHRCYYCKESGKHHSCLCPKKFGVSNESNLTAETIEQTEPGTSSSSDLADGTGVTTNLLSFGEKSIMQTALVTVQGQRGTLTARMLLDVGASRSFCKSIIVQQIGAKFVGSETVSISNFEATKRKNVKYLSYEISLMDKTGNPIKLTVSATKTISCPVERQALSTEAYPLLKQITLADTLIDNAELADIDILIGSDYYYDIVGSEQIRCSGGLVLLGSRFGYVVGGKVSADIESVSKNNSILLIQSPTVMPDNNSTLERFWRLEEIGISDKPEEPSDIDALAHFNRTVRFDKGEGRYEVRWPWKVEDPELPNNYDLSLKRLKGMTRRTNADTLRKYGEVIDDQKRKGVIEEAPTVPDGTTTHYLPHHLIINPEKTTTKLRVVYDASSKTDKSVLSLNECLHRGPVFLSDLCGLLMRFRLSKIAIASDIEKAFLQISLMVADRDVTRFLWLRELSKPPSNDTLPVSSSTLWRHIEPIPACSSDTSSFISAFCETFGPNLA